MVHKILTNHQKFINFVNKIYMQQDYYMHWGKTSIVSFECFACLCNICQYEKFLIIKRVLANHHIFLYFDEKYHQAYQIIKVSQIKH